MATRTAPTPEVTQPMEPPDAGRGPLLLKVGLPVVAVLVMVAVDLEAVRAIATATLGSPRALLIVSGVVALTVGWSALLRRFVPNEWLQAGLVLVPLMVVGALYVLPYFGGDVVVEDEFPVALAPVGTTVDDAEDVPPVADAPAPAGTIQEDGEADAIVAAPTPTTVEPVEPVEPVATVPPAPAPPVGPVELSRGSFVGLDGHYANGQAAIYDLGDGTHLVRLEEVDLQAVPDPYVYVVPTAGAASPTEGSLNLGQLKGNVGNQNYDVPPGVDLGTGEWTVLVWCEVFASPVGAASQG